ncbi:MAG: RodZ domain-containing protein [Pseudomonadota bacterium]
MAERERQGWTMASAELEDAGSERTGLSPSAGVGEVLRAARLKHNLSLREVSARLRIRRVFLAAIEDGRFEDLPGRTYAVSFVRAYAGLLGLDRQEIVRGFKSEAAGIDRPSELVFPRPIRESRLPGGSALLISLFVAVAGYGSWYYTTLSERTPIPRVASVPERLATMVERPVASSSSQAEAAMITVPAPAPARPAADALTGPPSTPEAADSPVDAPAASRAPRGTEVAALPAPPRPGPGEETGIPSPPAEVSYQPRVFGDTGTDVRIVIRAAGESWVQVRNPAYNVIFTRIMRQGDVYRVPNQVGLLLNTGSAGVLDIRVDDRPAPPIGRPGFVRRDVALDPGRLLAGTAVPEPGAGVRAPQ